MEDGEHTIETVHRNSLGRRLHASPIRVEGHSDDGAIQPIERYVLGDAVRQEGDCEVRVREPPAERIWGIYSGVWEENGVGRQEKALPVVQPEVGNGIVVVDN